MKKLRRMVPPTNNPGADVGAGSIEVISHITERWLRCEAQQSVVDKLFVAAQKGDEECFDALLVLANYASIKIFELTKSNGETARRLARQRKSWPSLYTLSDYLNQQQELLLSELELGAGLQHPLDLDTVAQLDTTPRRIVFLLLMITERGGRVGRLLRLKGVAERVSRAASVQQNEQLHEAAIMYDSLQNPIERDLASAFSSVLNALKETKVILSSDATVDDDLAHELSLEAYKLPKLTRETVNQWAMFGWGIVSHLTNEKPERCAVLRPLGEAQIGAFYQKEAKRRRPEDKDDTVVIRALAKELQAKGVAKKSAEGRCKRRIFERIRDTYILLMGAQSGAGLE